MTVLYRVFIAVLFIADPVDWFLAWYAAGLRDLSVASWIPSALLLGLFVFGATQCLAVGNIGAAALLSAVGLTFPAVKLGATVRG